MNSPCYLEEQGVLMTFISTIEHLNKPYNLHKIFSLYNRKSWTSDMRK